MSRSYSAHLRPNSLRIAVSGASMHGNSIDPHTGAPCPDARLPWRRHAVSHPRNRSRANRSGPSRQIAGHWPQSRGNPPKPRPAKHQREAGRLSGRPRSLPGLWHPFRPTTGNSFHRSAAQVPRHPRPFPGRDSGRQFGRTGSRSRQAFDRTATCRQRHLMPIRRGQRFTVSPPF